MGYHIGGSRFWVDALLEGKLKPPVDVKVQNDGDAHNFDTYDERSPSCRAAVVAPRSDD